MSKHSATGHDLYPIGLPCYGIMTGNLQFRHTFIVHKNLHKELITELGMQQLHQIDCNWTDNGHMFLHQGTNVLINSIDVVTNVTHLRTISKMRYLLILL